MDAFELRVLGYVRSPLTDPADAPRQGDEGAPDAVLELGASVQPALAGLETGMAVVVLTWLAMTPLAANPMSGVRRELGLPTRDDKKGVPPQAGSDETFAAARARLRPELVAGTGVLAIVILVWLMEMKPF